LSTVKLKVTRVFRETWAAFNDPDIEYIVNQGGTRSSKTYSIAQVLITWALRATGKHITVIRKTFPSLRASAMRDFFEILNAHDLYNQENHNKTNNEYILNGNVFEFIGLDQPQKKRGTKRDVLWINEGNELEYEDFFQLDIRTTGKTLIDYNPSDEYHWIYDKIIPQKTAKFIKSTYLDNPFLLDRIVRNIEKLKDEDETLWKVYGLGEKAASKDLIYTNWDIVHSFPDGLKQLRYGVDFGFNHPSVVLLVGVKGNDVYIDEVIYETRLTNGALIDRMAEEGVSKRITMRADCAEPDRIMRQSIYK